MIKNDGVALTQLPRYWQLSSDDKNLYKSPRLLHWITPNPESMNPQRIERLDGDKNVTAVQTTFLFPGDKKITLISGLDTSVTEAYKSQERERLAKPLYRILWGVGITLTVLCMLLVYYALRPIASIRKALESIRNGKSERIEGVYPQEIKTLTDEINHLLDYTSGSITKHREFSSNLAHSLKTPLTVIANESDIALIRTKLRSLMDIVDRNLARVYAAGTTNILSARTPILPVLQDIGEGFGKAYNKQVDINYPDNICFRGDKADLYEIVGNIIENACKFSRSRVIISHVNNAIVIEDDGDGIAQEQRTQALNRGMRLDESKPGSGIGLAVAVDIIALYQGDIRLESSMLSGLKVIIALPVQR